MPANSKSGPSASAEDPLSTSSIARNPDEDISIPSMRILLADDENMVRDTISAYLENESGAEVISVSDLPSVLKELKANGPFDLVLLDYDMPGMNGLEGLSRAQDLNANVPIAIFSGGAPKRIAQEALETGAVGFLPKKMTAKSLVNAVRFMVSGESYFPAPLLHECANDPFLSPEKQLSQREKQALRGLCRGQSNKEIARDLNIEEVTVKLHVRTLCRKLDAKNRTQAAMIAKDAGLI